MDTTSFENLEAQIAKGYRDKLQPLSDRFRLRFKIGQINCFTQPLTLEEIVDYCMAGELSDAFDTELPWTDTTIEYQKTATLWKQV